MKRTRFLAFFVAAIAACFFAVACEQLAAPPNTPRNPAPTVRLTVSAAASLKDVMEAIKPLYLEKNSDTAIAYNFGSSGSLQQQVEQGAPVDVLMTAAAKQMDNLQKKGLLLDETRQDLLTNRLVLIVPKEDTTIKGFKDLNSAAIKQIALGEPESVPVGKYAKEALTSLNLFDAVNAKAVYAKDVRQVLNYVETGNIEAGIVYETDAKTSDRVKIVETAPLNSHAPIVYPVAVIKASKQATAAKQFVQFLSSPEAKTLFEKFGFKSA